MNIIGTNIISALGFTTEENFNAVKQGISGVKHYDVGTFDLPEAFMASLIDKEKLNEKFENLLGFKNLTGLTDLEKASILSVFTANKEAQIDLSSKKTIFILSTTKGNVDLITNYELRNEVRRKPITIENNQSEIVNRKSKIFLWHSAKIISDFFKNPNTPIVVSNACISGAAAQIAAKRELESGKYDNAVVVGVDFLSKFIISGFQSFKALSPELCRPFDKDRCGLNLGEAAATLIIENEKLRIKNDNNNKIELLAGAIRNDATHISAPSRTGEGSYRALKNVIRHCGLDPQSPEKQGIPAFAGMTVNEIAFINAHGTATPYNDAMEVQAITRAGLENVPVNSLKSVFGHTLGAAGVLESIISIKALENGIVLPTLNFQNKDIENQLIIPQKILKTDKKYFIKMMSGFGGVNAALLFGYEFFPQSE